MIKYEYITGKEEIPNHFFLPNLTVLRHFHSVNQSVVSHMQHRNHTPLPIQSSDFTSDKR